MAPVVDCSRFSTDPGTVAIESIDYTPVVDGDPLLGRHGPGPVRRAGCVLTDCEPGHPAR
ncbi:hypothetical protein HET69_39980 [Streptomyces sp. CJ_13]|uniref:hypothetical protein n=1 Tax=Streptomyces TaxID=1883 RepID=UPI000F436AC3|nr:MULTISPECIES: hypothetical protein [unclassified Streptomyces]AYV26989.1 hypothetical protein EES41_09675 [Streptomyces sp. ADI95-16]MBT1189994.1 hypothetical protein [Streptomyces sp. CJ_13]